MIDNIKVLELIIMDYIGNNTINKIELFSRVDSTAHRIAKALENLKRKGYINYPEHGFVEHVSTAMPKHSTKHKVTGLTC